MVDIVASSGVRHVVQVSNPGFLPAVDVAARMIAEPMSFIKDPITASFAGSTGADVGAPYQIVKFPFRNSSQKREIMAAIAAQLETLRKTRSIRDAAILIADELFTNVVYNAPGTKTAEKLNASPRERGLYAELDENQSAVISVAYNDSLLTICCEDTYGSIDPTAIVKRIQGCYQRGVASSINYGKGGAGIGCYMILDQSSSFVIAVEPGKKTVVSVSLPLGLSTKAAMAVPKIISLIPIDGTL